MAALVRNYLEVYSPWAGGLSAVNAIGTHIRDPINSGLTRRGMHVCMYGHTYSKSMDQPGKVANPACGQLNRENEHISDRVRA